MSIFRLVRSSKKEKWLEQSKEMKIVSEIEKKRLTLHLQSIKLN